jgi:hypothetical protein
MKKYFFTLCLALFFANSYAQFSKDSLAITQLLEKEAATWRNGDIKAHADCWLVKPYSKVLVSTADGKFIDVPVSAIINPNPSSLGQGGYAILSNYKMSIKNKTAWVSHNEESVAKDGAKTYSYEIRLLEKVKGEWRLVGQSIHVYKK